MKKFLAILLCLALTVSCAALFTACEKDDQDGAEAVSIVGDWEATLDFGGIMEETMFTEGDAVPKELKDLLDFSKLKLTMCLSFEEDGEYRVSFDEESVGEMIDALLEMLSKAMKEMLTEMLEAQNLSLEEYLSLQNTTWEALMEETFPREEMIEDINETDDGEYKIEGNKLYFDGEEDEYTEFTLSSEKLTFTKVVSDDLDDDEIMGVLEGVLPLVFARK